MEKEQIKPRIEGSGVETPIIPAEVFQDKDIQPTNESPQTELRIPIVAEEVSTPPIKEIRKPLEAIVDLKDALPWEKLVDEKKLGKTPDVL